MKKKRNKIDIPQELYPYISVAAIITIVTVAALLIKLINLLFPVG